MLTTNTLGIGCSEKVIQIFAKYIDKNIFNVSVCCLIEGGIREKYIKESGISIYFAEGDPNKFKKIIEENNIDILHVNTISYPFLECARSVIPLIIETSIFGYTHHFTFEDKYIDLILFVSKMITIRYRRKLNLSFKKMKSKSNIIYNPIDFKAIKIAFSTKIAYIKEKLGITPEDFVIGKIGRRDCSKWSTFLTETIYHLRKKHKNFKILLIGAPIEIISEIKRKKLEPFFILLKPISEGNLDIFYELIDCLVHSSKIGESFGCTLSEAMAHKKPIIVNSTPLRDNAQIEVVDNYKTGFIVNYPEAGAQAILNLIQNKKLQTKLGQNGFQKALEKFNAKMLVKYLEKLYLLNLHKKGLISQEILYFYQNIQINTDINDLERYETEYLQRINNYFGFLTTSQYLKYFTISWISLISHIYKNILIPISLYPVHLIQKFRGKRNSELGFKTEIKPSIKKIYYFLRAILKGKYYEILYI